MANGIPRINLHAAPFWREGNFCQNKIPLYVCKFCGVPRISLCPDSVRVRDLFSTGCHPNSYESVARPVETIGRPRRRIGVVDFSVESEVTPKGPRASPASLTRVETGTFAVVPRARARRTCAQRINFARLFSTDFSAVPVE